MLPYPLVNEHQPLVAHSTSLYTGLGSLHGRSALQTVFTNAGRAWSRLPCVTRASTDGSRDLHGSLHTFSTVIHTWQMYSLPCKYSLSRHSCVPGPTNFPKKCSSLRGPSSCHSPSIYLNRVTPLLLPSFFFHQTSSFFDFYLLHPHCQG